MLGRIFSVSCSPSDLALNLNLQVHRMEVHVHLKTSSDEFLYRFHKFSTVGLPYY